MALRTISRDTLLLVFGTVALLLVAASIAAACIVNKGEMALTGGTQDLTVVAEPGNNGQTFMQWCDSTMEDTDGDGDTDGYAPAKATSGTSVTISVSPANDCLESGNSGNGANQLPEGEYMATWTEWSNSGNTSPGNLPPSDTAFVDDGSGGGDADAGDGVYHWLEREGDCMAVPPTDTLNAKPMTRTDSNHSQPWQAVTDTFRVDGSGTIANTAGTVSYEIPTDAASSNPGEAAGICITKVDQGPSYFQAPFIGGLAATQTSQAGPPVGNILPIEIQ